MSVTPNKAPYFSFLIFCKQALFKDKNIENDQIFIHFKHFYLLLLFVTMFEVLIILWHEALFEVCFSSMYI